MSRFVTADKIESVTAHEVINNNSRRKAAQIIPDGLFFLFPYEIVPIPRTLRQTDVLRIVGLTIKAEDKKGSGISKIEYAIVTGGSQYTDADTLKAANLSWKEYNSVSRPTVPVSMFPYEIVPIPRTLRQTDVLRIVGLLPLQPVPPCIPG